MRGCTLSLPLEAGEMVYGFGLQLLSFQQRGKKRIIRVNADPKGDAGDSHAPVPFYVTTNGYGVLVDTFRHAEFYCGEAHPKPTRAVDPQSIQVNTPQQTRARQLNEPSRMIVEVPRATGIDIYLFAGPSMLEAVQRYNAVGVLAHNLPAFNRPETNRNIVQFTSIADTGRHAWAMAIS